MKQRKITAFLFAAALIAIAAIGIAVFVLREPGTAAVPVDETSAVKKVVKKKPIKKVSVPAHAKPAEASPAKAAKPEPVRPEGDRVAVGENAVEPPKAEDMDAEKKAKEDNPFPRYLDMFRNNPAALVAEFEKEAAKDRVYQRELRDGTIDKLKMNEEQAAVFEKALDDLRDEIMQQQQKCVALITSGQLNDETAADGCIWDSNRILQYKMAATRQKLICDTAEKLYEQLELDGVSNADKQEFLFWAARQTSFSYECLEPYLQVYDKVYKNMGVGNGIFSWCGRQRQSQKK